jgi:cell division protein FtsZ
VLIQEAAHEDANIIFGAVIDEDMPEGEIRVTVIATGLDDARSRRPRETASRESVGHESAGRAVVDVGARPAQRERVVVTTSADAGVRASAERSSRAGAREDREEASFGASEFSQLSADFTSPFDDELDTPAFLRRRAHEN